MKLSFSIPACIILLILIISLISSAMPTAETLVCTKSEVSNGFDVDTRIVSYFSKEDVLKSSIMTIDISSDTEIPDIEMDNLRNDYENADMTKSIEAERLDANKITAEIVLSEGVTNSFGTKFDTVREYLITNYSMACNSK